jgi:plasmid stability protein
MTTTISLPETLEAQLQQQADAQHRSVEAVALDLLRDALAVESGPAIDDVVAKIRATRPNPQSVRPAQGSLADELRRTPTNADVDLAQWNREWAAVEAEIRAMTHTDDIAEGRV